MIDNVEEFQYEMKKSKSSRSRDRLSELPESLIFHIFWLLPMRDVVRTTILSKHWKNLWTTAPCLNFDNDDNPDDFEHLDTFRTFINRALILWDGIKIQKFKIDFRTRYIADEPFCDDVDFWLCFALRKKVQELYIKNPSYTDASLPQNLYSCSSLIVLSLNSFCHEINGNVQWNQLKSLTIDCVFLTEDVIDKVLCGSPQLEVFILTHVDCYENLSIRSSSLKRLSITYEVDDQRLGGELRIHTPNLETLKILGAPYTMCLLEDVSSLTRVNLGFYRNDLSDESDLLGETLKQVIPTIQHVEKVTLSEFCIKVLGDLIKKGLIFSSSNAKFLKLNNGYEAQCEQIASVLEIFPKLEMLVLKDALKFDLNLPESFMLHLRRIEITWGESDSSIFPFIKTVLEHASKLEKMVIRVAPPAPRSKSLFSASQKLLRMPRSSPTAELIFL